MKKMIKIKCQKRLLLIPLANILIFFIWIYNCAYMKLPSIKLINGVIVSFLRGLLVVIPQIILTKLFSTIPIVCTVINLFAIYLIPLCIGYRLIVWQKEMGIIY